MLKRPGKAPNKLREFYTGIAFAERTTGAQRHFTHMLTYMLLEKEKKGTRQKISADVSAVFMPEVWHRQLQNKQGSPLLLETYPRLDQVSYTPGALRELLGPALANKLILSEYCMPYRNEYSRKIARSHYLYLPQLYEKWFEYLEHPPNGKKPTRARESVEVSVQLRRCLDRKTWAFHFPTRALGV